MASVAPDSPPQLTDHELVDDRALGAFGGDEFNHGDFVRELAGVVLKSETPTNIALFGAWGSGKSGIANLLKGTLPTDKREAHFVLFDASKYAEAPLRRHFISQVAYGLENKAHEYHDGLYTGIEGRDVEFKPGELPKLLLAFLIATAATMAVLVVIALLVALVSVGPTAENWSGITRDYLLTTLPAAAVITAFIKLASDGFHVKTTRSAPSGDEQFESRFKDLVAEAKTKRVVVFIDELDRCSPAQVASVLETLKTFLFIKGCVFVVAADQQVLEQALRRKVRQHTPEDVSNPYYSAGSSYLDKVFQYQLTLPPLRAPTLSRFALSLVESRTGVWQRVADLDEVVSVLIPTHVVSPRRVKVLLNRFAIAYRLAERRASSGVLDPQFGERATELAKLVCLQCEFPLFAEDLTLDARLPHLVRCAADGDPLPDNLPVDVVRRAKAYAEGRLIVAELLVNGDPQDSARAEAVSDEMTEAETDTDEDEDAKEEDEAPTSTRGDDVARQHAQQLVSYLQKTRDIPGPSPDLLYLESAGAGHGIDALRADQLQRAALDNDTPEVLRIVAASAEEGEGLGALLVLADVVRQAQPGVEGRNVVRALMQSIERSGVELGEAADPIADALAGHLTAARLGEDDLPGALTLASACQRDVGPRLLAAVLAHPASITNPALATRLVGQAADVADEMRDPLAAVTVTALLHDSEEVGAQLASLDPQQSARLLTEAVPALKSPSTAHYKAAAAIAEAPSQTASNFRSAAPTAASVPSRADILDPAPADALAAVLDSVMSGEHRVLASQIVGLMLSMEETEFRDQVEERLPVLAPLTEGGLVWSVLHSANRRVLGLWPTWLGSIDPQVIRGSDVLISRLDILAATWWAAVAGEDTRAVTIGAIERAVASLARLVPEPFTGTELYSAVETKLMVAYPTEELIQAQAEDYVHADRLVEAGLLEARALADIRLDATHQTLQDDALAASLVEDVTTAAIEMVTIAAPHASSGALTAVARAVPKATWLPADAATLLLLTVATRTTTAATDSDSPASVEHLVELASDERGIYVADAVALWLDAFAGGPNDVWQVLAPMCEDELPSPLRTSLDSYCGRQTKPAQYKLIELALDSTASQQVDRSFFEAARLSEASQGRVAGKLIELFAAAEGDDQRRRLVELWQQLAPTGTAAKRLVKEVYIPLVEGGDENFKLALSFFGLVQSVPDIRGAVRGALRGAARTKAQKGRVDSVLAKAGWTKKSLFGLGPKKDKG